MKGKVIVVACFILIQGILCNSRINMQDTMVDISANKECHSMLWHNCIYNVYCKIIAMVLNVLNKYRCKITLQLIGHNRDVQWCSRKDYVLFSWTFHYDLINNQRGKVQCIWIKENGISMLVLLLVFFIFIHKQTT